MKVEFIISRKLTVTTEVSVETCFKNCKLLSFFFNSSLVCCFQEPSKYYKKKCLARLKTCFTLTFSSRLKCNEGNGTTPLYVNVNMNSGETVNTWVDALSASFAGVQVRG